MKQSLLLVLVFSCLLLGMLIGLAIPQERWEKDCDNHPIEYDVGSTLDNFKWKA